MFIVRHRGDGMYWVRIPQDTVRRHWAAWTVDSMKATPFTSARDAFDAAYAECPTPIPDLEVVDLVHQTAVSA